MSAELQALAISEDELHLCRLAWAEFNGERIDLNHTDEIVSQVPGTVIIDAKSIYDALTSQNQPMQLTEKRTALELLAYLKIPRLTMQKPGGFMAEPILQMV